MTELNYEKVMTTVKVTETIYMEPSTLCSNLKTLIKRALIARMDGKCDQTYGYILGVEDGIKIKNNTVSSASDGVFFTVEFKIKALKPKIGDEFKGTVCMVFEQGIFVEVENKMKVLIPTEKMTGFKYSKSKERFKSTGAPKKYISRGDGITVILDKIKYENQNFSCIGSLKTL